jgi:hypothetical protein
MRISRKPTGEKFFELFTETGASVELLREFVQVPVEQRAELAARMHALENTGDEPPTRSSNTSTGRSSHPSTGRCAGPWPPTSPGDGC